MGPMIQLAHLNESTGLIKHVSNDTLYENRKMEFMKIIK